jgi:hypothetical protein
MTASKTKATAEFSAHFTHQCNACDGHVKSVRREFSDQAWAALVAWKELSSKAVDAPLCNDCYFNFRDVLIERADEMRLMALNTVTSPKTGLSSNLAHA